MESNHRHGDFQSPAIPTELSGHNFEVFFAMVKMTVATKGVIKANEVIRVK